MYERSAAASRLSVSASPRLAVAIAVTWGTSAKTAPARPSEVTTQIAMKRTRYRTVARGYRRRMRPQPSGDAPTTFPRMTHARTFRFGVQASTAGADGDWAALARKSE